MKRCELCKGLARIYCESDTASLCWDCDAKVHSANFLVARHSRSLLCQVCQSPTAWSASGSKLGPTVSVCVKCLDRYRRDGIETCESVDDVGSGTDEEDEETDGEDEAEYEDEDEIDPEDIQVVPWSSTSPPPPASSSSSEESLNRHRNVSLKRMRENDADLQSDDDSGSSSSHRKVRTSLSLALPGGDDDDHDVVAAAAGVCSCSARVQRTEARGLTNPRCKPIVEFIRRISRQRMSSSSTIAELCRLGDDSRAVDLEKSETT